MRLDFIIYIILVGIAGIALGYYLGRRDGQNKAYMFMMNLMNGNKTDERFKPPRKPGE